MKLIIDIPEHDKNVIERFVRGDGCEDFPPSIIENLIRAVYFGTPLPKGHGRLIDADRLRSMYSINRANFNTVVGIQKWIDDAPTIIEAESEDKE